MGQVHRLFIYKKPINKTHVLETWQGKPTCKALGWTTRTISKAKWRHQSLAPVPPSLDLGLQETAGIRKYASQRQQWRWMKKWASLPIPVSKKSSFHWKKKKRKSEAEKKEDEKRPRFGNGFDFGGGGGVFVCFVRESSYKGRAEILHGWSKGIDEERRSEVIIYH